MAAATRTTCPYCGVGCGVIATPRPNGSADIKGDAEHPANFGRLCSKGAALGETLSLDGRLLHPEMDGARVTWDAALDRVASTFRDTIAAHGPDSVALYVSGQILTEDYYVANKLVKGFFGTANIDTNSRLCMASSVAGHKRAFGADTVPNCYEDLEQADLVVLVGSNLAWCHPVLYQRLAAAREARGTKIVVIDPRRTATCEIADLHLALAPGCDVALFQGLLQAIVRNGADDVDYVERFTSGFSDAHRTAATLSVGDIAEATGLSAAELQRFYDLFVAIERVVTVYSQGVNQSVAGTDKVNAIINCHLATGRIGRPGMGPFSVTGQPNAMGGRETGGLATMLAAHMDLADAEHRHIVQSFWRSPRIADTPGLKAVDLFRAIAAGRVKAIWIMATNPVDSLPEADLVRSALENCPFVVVSDVVRETDTTHHAHVLLPALAWGEKSGTVTNSERRISRQRSFLPAPGEARADWWQIAEVAKRLGWGDAFAWTNARDVFDEYARLTTIDNNGRRDLDLGDLVGLSDAAYDTLDPVQWPKGRSRFFADGDFYTPDRKARFVATPYRPLATAATQDHPLVFNTGRIRDQWHTMTRTAKAPRLSSHIAEPYVEVHPEDARIYGLIDATIAELTSPHGRALARVVVTERQRPGSLFAPFHFVGQVASAGRINALVTGAVDPISAQPELKGMPIAARPYAADWYGFAVCIAKPAFETAAYWALARTPTGWRVELADATTPEDWDATSRRRFALTDRHDVVSYRDLTTGAYRCAVFDGSRLIAALFVSRAPVAVARSHLVDLLGSTIEDPGARLGVLSGRPPAGAIDKGAIVCACFEIGRNQIIAAAKAGAQTVAAVGAATSAGTNCGSCRAEIGRLLDAGRSAQAG